MCKSSTRALSRLGGLAGPADLRAATEVHEGNDGEEKVCEAEKEELATARYTGEVEDWEAFV